MRALLIIIGLILAGYVFYYCIDRHAPVIEADINARSRAAAATANLGSGVEVNVSGRDVTLLGNAASEAERDRAGDVIKKVAGVRVVDNKLAVPSAPVAAIDENEREPLQIIEEPELKAPEPEITAQNDIEDIDLLPIEESEEEVAAEEDVFVSPDSESSTDEKKEAPSIVEEPVVAAPEINTPEAEEPVVEKVEEPEAKEETAPIAEEPMAESPPAETALTKVEETSGEQADIKTCQERMTKLIGGDNINFQTGQTKIAKESIALLKVIALGLKSCSSDVALHIHGHTDNLGDRAANRKLSHARAKEVGMYLINIGVMQKVKVFGHGPDQPVASNDNEEGRAKNRRIEFVIASVND